MGDRNAFRILFLQTYDLNPSGENWMGIAQMLAPICTSERRKIYPWSLCVLWARELCQEAGLLREDRIAGPNHVDMTEGYVGVSHK